MGLLRGEGVGVVSPKANYLGHLGPVPDSRDDKEGFEGFKVSKVSNTDASETLKRETLQRFPRISACK